MSSNSSAPASNTTSPTAQAQGSASGTRIDMMLDIETFSTSQDALVLTMGAVLFDPFGTPGSIVEEYHVPLILEDQIGAKTDLNTVFWWMTQNDAAGALTHFRANSVLRSVGNVHSAFLRLCGIVKATKGKHWGNAPSFDQGITKRMFERAGLDAPWAFYDERCYRTLKAEFGQRVTLPANNLAHDALSDAKAQAHGVQLIMRSIHDIGSPKQA